MKIPYVNLNKQWNTEKKSLLKIIDQVASKNLWVGGGEVQKFEKKISKICKTKYAVALNSGTDALTLGLFSLGIKRGDEVITTSNSFIASTATIVHIGAVPVFVDVLDNQLIDHTKIEDKITKKTKAIMLVHLGGRIANIDYIKKISKKYKIPIIEDAAQSIGSKYRNKPAGSIGEIGCFSAHPLKNLNALGDSGYVTTNNEIIYKTVKSLSNHGHKNRDIVERFGHVSRMDTIQAAILNYRLKNLNKNILKRRKNAELYRKYIKTKKVFITTEDSNVYNTYHTFVIQVDRRDQLKKFLYKKGIFTSIHYPIPIHLQPATKKLKIKTGNLKMTEIQSKKIITLPVNQFLSEKEIKYISKMINIFYG
jgi:dTDP-4-amino-4,6-dideoxygalactose transaminase